jgi:hypothetical protein
MPEAKAKAKGKGNGDNAIAGGYSSVITYCVCGAGLGKGVLIGL